MSRYEAPSASRRYDLRSSGEIGTSAAGPRERVQRLAFLDGEHNRRIRRLWHAPQYHITTV